MQLETSYKKFLAGLLVVVVFFLGWQYGRAGGDINVNALGKFIERNRDSAPKDVNWQLLWDAIITINDKYVNKPADLQKILYGAISGAVNSLEDPYSVFLPPQQAQEFADELQGNLEGIGAEIAIKPERL